MQVLWGMASESHGKEWGVRELGENLQLSPASAHRLLALLVTSGLVERDASSGRYRVGSEAFRLGLMLSSHLDIRNVGTPVMGSLVAQCNETAFLGMYDPARMEVMFVAAVSSSHPLRYVVPLNMWFPVHAGASGMSIMAFLPKEEQQGIIARKGLPALTPNTITDPGILEKELDRIRVRGYAISIGHRNLGAVAVAAPIFGVEGRVVGDLALSIPEPRFEGRMEQDLALLVMQHAKQITDTLAGKVGEQASADMH
jgi:IclR family transcriptional regulator, acetate operon repressor